MDTVIKHQSSTSCVRVTARGLLVSLAIGGIISFAVASLDAHAWTNPVIGELVTPLWSNKADDNAKGETVPSTFYKRLVDSYLANPEDLDARRNLGLLPLTVAVANWGVVGEGLPKDPNGTAWKANTGADLGKHLMSYDIGGVGISHIDSEELGKFVRFVAGEFVQDPEQKKRFLRFADRENFKTSVGSKPSIKFDQIRAAGVCAAVRIHTDLSGEPFAENHPKADQKYCLGNANPNFTVQDWQLFRTYVRMALRSETGQEWVINSWLDNNWEKSISLVLKSGGTPDEAMANARVRNSWPDLADRAVHRPANTPAGMIQRELDSYALRNNGATAHRRCPFILRSVALYRAYANEVQVTDMVSCPPDRRKK